MCDCKQILSIHISEATKVSLSMSSFSKHPNALYESGTIFRQCTHSLSHQTGKRKESPQGDQAAYTAAGRLRSCSK